jgi:putative nucleotidyltransferase with HDIG domain
MYRWVGAEQDIYRFATAVGASKTEVCLRLISDAALPDDLVLEPFGAHAHRVKVECEPVGGGQCDVVVTVTRTSEIEDKWDIIVKAQPEVGIPDCLVLLRWTDCKINDALLLRAPGTVAAMQSNPEAARSWAQTKAALLWHSFGRYSEVIGLKRFTSGKSGSEVLVFRPRLRNPQTSDPALIGATPLDVVSNAWGAYLLIKTGKIDKVRKEWDRFQIFLADRIHPFMSRSEALLTVQPVNIAPFGIAPPPEAAAAVADKGADDPSEAKSEGYATIIGTFLGGDLLQAEPFQAVLRDATDPHLIEKTLDRIFAVTGAWYAGSAVGRLGDWWKMIQPPAPPQGEPGLSLFGKFDLKQSAQRSRFTAPLMWDIAFVREEHLIDHLLGKHQDGLLYRLMDLPVRNSLIHGDLQARNILADPDNVWLIDFGETGIGPTLFDFAKLEVYLRLWCLDMAPAANNVEEDAMRLETLLLDAFTATEVSLEPIRAIASTVGAPSEELLKVARAIAGIRRRALPYCVDGAPDRREYLAVLFLTVLNTLQYAGTDTAPMENYRWIMALYWVLEDTLSNIVGLAPFDRGRTGVKYEQLLTPQWLAGEGAPRRVLYWLERPDGQKALAPLAATRGVLQGHSHHLDVFDHTLLVLANLEEILKSPVESLLHPDRLDQQVEASLTRQGISFPSVCDHVAPPSQPIGEWLADYLPGLSSALSAYLTSEHRLLAKWVALFHDVGKPATRVMSPDARADWPRTQFFGHEVYGAQLVAKHLDALFPGDANQRQRDTVSELIRRHHLHHTQVNRYNEPEGRLFQELQASVTGDMLTPGDHGYLLPFWDKSNSSYLNAYPLLILHGFADMLACRGPIVMAPVEKVAEIDLALLILYFRYPMIRRRLEAEEQFRKVAKGPEDGKGLSQELIERYNLRGQDLGRSTDQLKQRFMAVVCAETGDEQPTVQPTLGDLLKWAPEVIAAGRKEADGSA